jgi:hypothetical protein
MTATCVEIYNFKTEGECFSGFAFHLIVFRFLLSADAMIYQLPLKRKVRRGIV